MEPFKIKDTTEIYFWKESQDLKTRFRSLYKESQLFVYLDFGSQKQLIPVAEAHLRHYNTIQYMVIRSHILLWDLCTFISVAILF